MSNHLMTDLELLNLTPELVGRAVRTVAHHAADDAEARWFCQALGLLPTVPARPEARDATGRMRSGTYRKEQA